MTPEQELHLINEALSELMKLGSNDELLVSRKRELEKQLISK